jgi:hypothetical protein
MKLRPKGRSRSTKALGSEHVEELLGKVVSFILFPFLPAPAYRQAGVGRDPALKGWVSGAHTDQMQWINLGPRDLMSIIIS